MFFATLTSATNPAFLAIFGENIEILLAGVPAFTCLAIVNTDPGYQTIAGVGLVSAEPHIVLLTNDAANIPATATIRINSFDWQLYGEPINHRNGMTTLKLISP